MFRAFPVLTVRKRQFFTQASVELRSSRIPCFDERCTYPEGPISRQSVSRVRVVRIFLIQTFNNAVVLFNTGVQNRVARGL